MSEQKMWVAIRPLFAGLDPVRVENPAHPGTPDVNYIGGWVELKHAYHWPKRPDTVFIIRHFTPEQRTWLIRRWAAGGAVHLLLQVANDWLLFTGPTAAAKLNFCTKMALIEAADKHWVGRPTHVKEFQKWLMR